MEQNVQPVSLWKTRPFQLFPIQYILQHIPYSGKLSRISRFCDYLQKFSLQNLWGVASFGAAKASICESFLRKKLYFHQFVKVFSLESFLLYSTGLACNSWPCSQAFPQLPVTCNMANWTASDGKLDKGLGTRLCNSCSVVILKLVDTGLVLSLARSGGGQFLLPSNLSISVQQLLHAIECACTQSHTPCSGGRSTPAFVKQDHLLDCIMVFVTRLAHTHTHTHSYM